MELLAATTIIAVLVALLTPAAVRIKERADAARSFSNLRQVGTALLMMSNDQEGVINHWYFGNQVPGISVHWVSQLNSKGYLDIKKLEKLRCTKIPSQFGANIHNWGFNLSDPHGVITTVPTELGGTQSSRAYQLMVRTHPNPATSVLLGSVSTGAPPSGSPTDLRIFPTGSNSNSRVFLAHQKRAPLFFLDGHAEWADPSRLFELRSSLGRNDYVEFFDEEHTKVTVNSIHE